MRSVLFLALTLSLPLTGGCQPEPAPPASEAAATPIVQLAPSDFVAEREPGAVVLDVRTPGEYADGHLVGARNVNVGAADFRARVESLDRTTPVYLYCRSGNRSRQAAEIMREMGFTTLYNAGGYADLKRAGAEVVEP